jgi:glycosyltransferase involved in cell wall biosynthesis
MSNFISIIIPVFNDPKGLRDTISTLIENNKAIKNYEILVCNDGSGSKEIKEIKRLIQKYNYIKIINIVPNQGSYNARNEGIKIAKGNIIAFLDAGVFVQKGWYEEVNKNIENYDYLAGNVKVPLKWAKNPGEIYDAITAFPVKNLLQTYHFGVTANLVIKKNIISKVGYFDRRLRSGGDLDFGRRIYQYGIKQVYLQNLKVLHKPRGLREAKIKTKRVLQGTMDLIKFYPNTYSYLKNRLFIIYIIKQVLLKSLVPWVDQVFKKGLITYVDFIKIEIVLALNKIYIIKKLRRNK